MSSECLLAGLAPGCWPSVPKYQQRLIGRSVMELPPAMPSADHQGLSKARNILLAGEVPTVAMAAASLASCRNGLRSTILASGSEGIAMITCRAVTRVLAPPGGCTVSDTPRPGAASPGDGATPTTGGCR